MQQCLHQSKAVGGQPQRRFLAVRLDVHVKVDTGMGRWGLDRDAALRAADEILAGPRPERLAAIKESLEAMCASEKADDWNWIDAMQMAMPAFAKRNGSQGWKVFTPPATWNGRT